MGQTMSFEQAHHGLSDDRETGAMYQRKMSQQLTGGRNQRSVNTFNGGPYQQHRQNDIISVMNQKQAQQQSEYLNSYFRPRKPSRARNRPYDAQTTLT